MDDLTHILRHILKDFTPLPDAGIDFSWSRLNDSLPRTLTPDTVFLTLVLGCKCPYVFKPMEKVLWSILFGYKGIPVRIECGRFGLWIYTPRDAVALLDISALARSVHRAAPIVDRLLQPAVADQLARGHFSVPNRLGMLTRRYHFFRLHASEAYARPEPSAEEILYSDDPFKHLREGFFYGTAAIDSYFSRLEHTLVLLFPFVVKPESVNTIDSFIAGSWRDKFRLIAEHRQDRQTWRLYEALVEIKRSFRNPLAHGGFESGNASLLVHVPPLGALPVQLSRYKDSIYYSVVPIEASDFIDVCKTFDAVDECLAQGRTRFGLQYILTGLDVPCDALSLGQIREAMTSGEMFGDFLETIMYRAEREANMEW